jgi:hypothetical protein
MRPVARISVSSALAAVIAVILASGSAWALPCLVPDNGSGTADLPPVGCGYASEGPLVIVDGLPPGSPIQAMSSMDSFFDITYAVGGVLGGEREMFHASLPMHLVGTGVFTGYDRVVNMPIICETHSAPHPTAVPVQSFAHELYLLQGQLVPGDPDFDLLRITAGTGFGMPSPGHTTLVQAGGSWAVDSFFDITYRIDFVGQPGGPFAGMSGSTTATIRLHCGETIPTAVEIGTWGRIKSIY